MTWTHARIRELSILWDQGCSAREIGFRMGISSNSVIGKAHRLTLPPRQSPLGRGKEIMAKYWGRELPHAQK
jgi:GcrA cell cycle regulator